MSDEESLIELTAYSDDDFTLENFVLPENIVLPKAKASYNETDLIDLSSPINDDDVSFIRNSTLMNESRRCATKQDIFLLSPINEVVGKMQTLELDEKKSEQVGNVLKDLNYEGNEGKLKKLSNRTDKIKGI